MNEKYMLIVFDWDGTLYNSSSSTLNHLKQAVADLKWPMFDFTEYTALSGLSISRIIDALYIDVSEEEREMLKIRYRFHALLHQNDVTLYSDAKYVLQTLKDNGYLLALATRTSAERLARDLDSLKLNHCFDAIRTVDKTEPKPSPRMVDEIRETLGVPRKKTLVVGDSILDIQMAMNADVDAVGINQDPKQREVLIAQGALTAVSTLTELLSEVFRLP